MSNVKKIIELAQQVFANEQPSSNTHQLVGSLLMLIADYLKSMPQGGISGYIYCKSESDFPQSPTDKEKRCGFVLNGNIYFYVGEGGDFSEGRYQNGGRYSGPDGKSAYEVAVDNGFEGTAEEWLASLKEISDYQNLMVESRPENPQTKIIYGIPAADGQSWTEEFWDGAKWVVLATHEGKSVEIDETLTKEGAAADAKVVGEIKNIVGYREKTDLTAGLKSGLIKTGTSVGEIASLQKSSNSEWLSGIFELSKSTEVIITGTGSVSFRLYSIIDINNVVLQVSESEATVTNQIIKIEQDCRIVVNFDKTKNYSLFIRTQGEENNILDNIEAIEEKIDGIQDEISNLNEQIYRTKIDLTKNLKKEYAIVTGNTIGSVAPLNEIYSSSYSSGIFDVFKGDTVYLYGIGGIDLSRKYALIDKDNKVLDISDADKGSVQQPYETVVKIEQDCRIVVNLDVRSVMYSPTVVVEQTSISLNEKVFELDKKIFKLEESIDTETEGFIDITNTFDEEYGIKTGEAVGDIATLDLVANNNYKSGIITAAYGETYYITGSGGTTTRLFALIDKNNRVFRVSGNGISVKNYEIVIERNCRLVVNSLKNSLKVVKKTKKKYIYHEVPDNIGLHNAVMNANQLINILYQTLAKMPSQGGTFNQGSWNKGMIYSSTRQEDLWIGNNVSFHTFLSAMTSPNSYIYTINVANKYGLNNAACFYGTVCSQFVCYALGIKVNYQTRQWRNIPGMVKVRNQSAYGLKIGDTFLSGGYEVGVGSYSSGHVRMCIDIVKDQDGIIQYVTVAEAVQPKVISKNYTAEQINSWLSKDGYEIYRYEDAWKATHTPSEYIPVADEDLDSPTSFNENIMPRRGDKANWHNNEDVIIDILNKGNFTSYKLYKDDVLLSTVKVEDLVINLGVLPYGSYKLCLTDGMEDSRFVYFIVADYNVEAISLGDGNVKVSFSSANATPLWVCWCVNREKFPTWSVPIDKNDISNGYLITKYRTGNNVWSFKVYFETDYGIICSDFIPCDIE